MKSKSSGHQEVDENNRDHIKVMYLIDAYKTQYAGTEKQLMYILDNISNYSVNPQLAIFKDSEYVRKYGFNCPHEILGINKMFNPKSIIRLFRMAARIKKENVMIVHIFFNDASIVAPLILKLFGLKVIVSRRDMGFWHTRTTMFLMRINQLFIDKIVTNCIAVKKRTSKLEWARQSKIELIYNGYLVNSKQVLTHADVKSKQKCIGIVCNIKPVKRVEDALYAFHNVHKRIPDTKLVIVGSGPTERLEKIIKELALEDDVNIMGEQKNALKIISGFDVGILCSESEGCSNTIVEYMFSNVPVVCTDAGGNNELVIDGKTGFLYPVGDIDKLADKMVALLSDRNLANRIKATAYRHISSLCDMDNMLLKHYKLYKSLVSCM